MANETVMWTVLPTGIEEPNPLTGTRRALKFSLFLTPKLTPSGDLGDGHYPTFEHWTTFAQTLSIGIEVEGATFPGTGALAPAVLDLGVLQADHWSKVFPASTPVNAWVDQDLSGRTLRSYSVSPLKNRVLGLYNAIATNPNFATVHPQLNATSPVKTFINTLAPIHRLLSTYRSNLEKQGGDPDHTYLDSLAGDLPAEPAQFFQALRFYMRPRGSLTAGQLPPVPELPKYDFHQAISLLSDHGPLLRMLGIVIDGRVLWPRDAKVLSQSRLRVASIAFGSGGQGLVSERPWTAYRIANQQFLPLPKLGSEIRQGLLWLANQTLFDVFEVDADGAALKVTDFAVNMARLVDKTAGQTTRKPDSAALPALRSAGFTLIRRDRAQAVQTQAAMLPAANLDPDAVTLSADDVTRGYRVDVLARGAWHSICRREGNLRVGTAESSVDIPIDDEGYLKAVSATSSRTPGVAVDELYLHEAFATWKGWSLVARRPGRVIPAPPDKEPVPPNREVLTDFGVASDYRATQGSLPRLRFGELYRFRVRTVDLAGNSLPLDATPPGTFWQSRELPYLRYEPVASPALVPQAPLREGETIETLAIRTQVMAGQNPLDPALFNAETGRHVVPPKTSQSMAEQHGMLDPYLPDDPALAFRISVKEQGTLMDREIVNPYETAFDPAIFPAKLEPVDGVALAEGTQVIPWPVFEDPADAPEPGDPLPRGQYVIHTEDQIALPYLPDPAARGLALRSGNNSVFFHAYAGSWPDARPFRLIVRSGAPAVTALADGNVELTLAPGTMTRLLYSSLPSLEQLPTLAFAQNLGATLLAAAQTGQHWMLTPYRELLIVHAVQKPLQNPVLLISPEREIGSTYASMRGSVSSEPHSTAEAEIHGTWTDPVDTGPDGPSLESHSAFAFKRGIGYDEALANFPKTKGGSAPRHEFGDTKHRVVTYRALGKTRYAKYFPTSITDDVANITRSGAPAAPVNIRSTARPDAPRVLYVVPTFRWIESEDGLSSQRVGHGLRVYLDRPWYSSGAGELLSVVLPTTPITADAMQNIRAYVSEWGADPVWSNDPPLTELAATRFKNRILTLGNVMLGEREEIAVRVAAFPVEFDAERKLWRCDIEMDVGNLYFPFVRLALARLQPNSVYDVRLSSVVKTEFAQLTPDRTLSLVPRSDAIGVTLTGPEALNQLGQLRTLGPNPPARRGAPLKPNLRAGAAHLVRAQIERRLPIPGPSPEEAVDWVPLGDDISLSSFTTSPEALIVSWTGDVPWINRDPDYQYRLVVREYEVFGSDPGTADGTTSIGLMPPFFQAHIAARLVHLDILPLTP